MIEGQTLQQVDYVVLVDKEPVYVQLPQGLESQWGIADTDNNMTIHKDFTLKFSKNLKYFVTKKKDEKHSDDNLIKMEDGKITKLA